MLLMIYAISKVTMAIIHGSLLSLSDIPYLRELHLNRNPLQKVEANAFVMVPELVSLDLSHCNIKRIAAKGFAQLNSLEKLYINHNEIRELKRATVDTFKGNYNVNQFFL